MCLEKDWQKENKLATEKLTQSKRMWGNGKQTECVLNGRESDSRAVKNLCRGSCLYLSTLWISYQSAVKTNVHVVSMICPAGFGYRGYMSVYEHLWDILPCCVNLMSGFWPALSLWFQLCIMQTVQETAESLAIFIHLYFLKHTLKWRKKPQHMKYHSCHKVWRITCPWRKEETYSAQSKYVSL